MISVGCGRRLAYNVGPGGCAAVCASGSRASCCALVSRSFFPVGKHISVLAGGTAGQTPFSRALILTAVLRSPPDVPPSPARSSRCLVRRSMWQLVWPASCVLSLACVLWEYVASYVSIFGLLLPRQDQIGGRPGTISHYENTIAAHCIDGPTRLFSKHVALSLQPALPGTCPGTSTHCWGI